MAGVSGALICNYAVNIEEKERLLNVPKSFVRGSIDEAIMDHLESGDLVFFNEKCSSKTYFNGAACFIIKHILNSPYTHCGVIAIDKLGTPHILEATQTGPKFTPYETRILQDNSDNIVVVKLTSKERELIDVYFKTLFANGFKKEKEIDGFTRKPYKLTQPSCTLVLEVLRNAGFVNTTNSAPNCSIFDLIRLFDKKQQYSQSNWMERSNNIQLANNVTVAENIIIRRT